MKDLMSKRKQARTEKNKYPSRYRHEGYCHAAQYITELICEKKAKVDGKELPFSFWDQPDWLKYFKYQIVIANRLLKKYDEYAIIATLHDNRMWKTYSLRSPFLEKIIQEYVDKAEVSKKIAEKLQYDFSKKETFKSNNNKTSFLSKLRDLE